ncbi:transaldolase [Rhodospirillaceae bacterium RKSG073]|nr:transaldolase [Curvivirga aplysinae]
MMVDHLRTQIFADGANIEDIKHYANSSHIKGFTTNPTLMRNAGVHNYEEFAKEALKWAVNKPISFEVLADDFDEMERQALKIANWGDNVNVKIPVSNKKGDPSYDVIYRLARQGVKVNVTAVFTIDQIQHVSDAMTDCVDGYISVFAGRIADTGIDPLSIMKEAVEIIKTSQNNRLIWASPREIFNLIQAHDIGCHIITLTPDLLKKLPLIGKDLLPFSKETVNMFYQDAVASEYTL